MLIVKAKLKDNKVLCEPDKGVILPDLNRSGRRYRMCYNLKTIALIEVDDKAAVNKLWKIRPAAIHHLFDLGYNCG